MSNIPICFIAVCFAVAFFSHPVLSKSKCPDEDSGYIMVQEDLRSKSIKLSDSIGLNMPRIQKNVSETFENLFSNLTHAQLSSSNISHINMKSFHNSIEEYFDGLKLIYCNAVRIDAEYGYLQPDPRYDRPDRSAERHYEAVKKFNCKRKSFEKAEIAAQNLVRNLHYLEERWSAASNYSTSQCSNLIQSRNISLQSAKRCHISLSETHARLSAYEETKWEQTQHLERLKQKEVAMLEAKAELIKAEMKLESRKNENKKPEHLLQKVEDIKKALIKALELISEVKNVVREYNQKSSSDILRNMTYLVSPLHRAGIIIEEINTVAMPFEGIERDGVEDMPKNYEHDIHKYSWMGRFRVNCKT